MKTQIFDEDVSGKTLARMISIDYDRSVLFFDDDTYAVAGKFGSRTLTVEQMKDMNIMSEQEANDRTVEKCATEKELVL